MKLQKMINKKTATATTTHPEEDDADDCPIMFG